MKVNETALYVTTSIHTNLTNTTIQYTSLVIPETDHALSPVLQPGTWRKLICEVNLNNQRESERA